MLIAGAVGGLVHVLLKKSEGIQLPRIFIDSNTGAKKIIPGIIKDMILGSGAAFISTAPIGLTSSSLTMIGYSSFIAGIGGGSVIHKMLKETTDNNRVKKKEQLSQFHVIEDEEE